MREIRFRAWLKNAKVMEYPKNNYSLFMWAESEHQPMEIMQYTGLKDKNGKEIYEGDVVRGVSGEHENESWEVTWDEDRDYSGWSIQPHIEVKIIGNIYENPDLIND